MIRAALWTNHLSDLPQLVDVQKSSRPVKFNFLLLLFFPFPQQPPVLVPPVCIYNVLFIFFHIPQMPFLPFPNPFPLILVFKIFFNLLILFMIQAPPPPTSCPCTPVGCRAISVLCVSKPSSTAAQITARACALRAAISSPALSLFLSRTHTQAHTAPCSDVT